MRKLASTIASVSVMFSVALAAASGCQATEKCPAGMHIQHQGGGSDACVFDRDS